MKRRLLAVFHCVCVLPVSQPLMTCPSPSLKLKVAPRSRDESNYQHTAHWLLPLCRLYSWYSSPCCTPLTGHPATPLWLPTHTDSPTHRWCGCCCCCTTATATAATTTACTGTAGTAAAGTATAGARAAGGTAAGGGGEHLRTICLQSTDIVDLQSLPHLQRGSQQVGQRRTDRSRIEQCSTQQSRTEHGTAGAGHRAVQRSVHPYLYIVAMLR